MLISGINRFSLIEFPGEICSVIFTLGCNFRCDYCHNSEFVLPEKIAKLKTNIIPQKAIFNFLESRKGQLSGVSICGGEPTMQKDLFEFCKKVKSMGFLVKLDTNGRDPDILQKLLAEKMVDYIAMDIKQEIGKFSEVAGVELDETNYLKSIDIILNSNINYEFRTTVIKGVHSKENIGNIAKYIKNAKSYFLQNFRPGITLNPNFQGESFSRMELEELKSEAEKYLKKVAIRN
ncbi:anaerobic ribonucleoside-triphosphate reductase activating protein [Candidatus Gracilibacteria bacterium HOT-871]|nr:anaerobic ribonucleoside-triphosphate reductase activating protein [Candidatus Gracilibacteria bacterium HOT-871]MBB1565032.1 anaerobic ribonucleoside-triphosphate reductase activating protein [Candidatus Gracilibacteria bacterium]RKW20677.1 MAG: anaerobic ribonucleoside-triphosphate reductase activating protein [Candidatus Gracilibacteria bacterium]